MCHGAFELLQHTSMREKNAKHSKVKMRPATDVDLVKIHIFSQLSEPLAKLYRYICILLCIWIGDTSASEGCYTNECHGSFFLLWCSYFLVMRGKRFELHRYKNALYTPSSSHENSRKMKLVRLFFRPYVSMCVFFCRIQFAALKLLAFWYCFRICLLVRRDYMLFFFFSLLFVANASIWSGPRFVFLMCGLRLLTNNDYDLSIFN